MCALIRSSRFPPKMAHLRSGACRPVRSLEFQVWHEKSGFVTTVKLDDKATKWDKGRFKKKLKKGANDLGEIKVAAKNFK